MSTGPKETGAVPASRVSPANSVLTIYRCLRGPHTEVKPQEITSNVNNGLNYYTNLRYRQGGCTGQAACALGTSPALPFANT
jgi:hypothetical protein